MMWWDVILSDITLLKTSIALGGLLLAYLLLIPHPAWTSYVALDAIAVGVF